MVFFTFLSNVKSHTVVLFVSMHNMNPKLMFMALSIFFKFLLWPWVVRGFLHLLVCSSHLSSFGLLVFSKWSIQTVSAVNCCVFVNIALIPQDRTSVSFIKWVTFFYNKFFLIWWIQNSEPAGAIVLERCRVLKDSSTQKKHGFTIGKLFCLL